MPATVWVLPISITKSMGSLRVGSVTLLDRAEILPQPFQSALRKKYHCSKKQGYSKTRANQSFQGKQQGLRDAADNRHHHLQQ
jgi:hypothetical protein